MISVSKQNQLIQINIDADILNTSSRVFNLEALKSAIINQLQQVFNVNVETFTINFSITLKVLKHVYQCSPKKVLFQIVDTIPNNNAADADLKGLRIKLNQAFVQEMIDHKNTRTIPHEVGHLFGWNHPHANAKYESINLEAHPFEQLLTEQQRQTNLMSQTWYAQRANIQLDKAIQLTQYQINVLLEYYDLGLLNKNFHLNYFLFWKKLVG
jgi:hypothetical protein